MDSNGLHKRAFVGAILIGLLPAWMVLLPLDITSEPEGWQIFVRSNSFAVPIAQLIFVVLAMSISFSPFRAISRLPHISKAAIAIWLIVAGIVSFQAGKDHLAAVIGLFKILFAGLFFLALVNLRATYGRRFLVVLWVSLGVGTILYLLLWAVHIFIVSPQGEEWVTRIPGVNNVRHTGHFAIAGVIAGLYAFIAFREQASIWLRWALPLLFTVLGLGLALWTGSRGPLLASLITMLVTFSLAAQQRRLVARFCIVSALAATAAVAVLPVPNGIYGIAGATGMADVSAQSTNVSSGRTGLWAATFDKIAERPLVGWGVNQFGKFGPSNSGSFLHPHNYPLQFLFSGGVLSVLLTLMVLIPPLRQKKWPYTQGPSAAAVGGVIGLLVYSLYDGVLYFSYPTMIFIVAVVTSLAPASTKPDRGMSN